MYVGFVIFLTKHMVYNSLYPPCFSYLPYCMFDYIFLTALLLLDLNINILNSIHLKRRNNDKIQSSCAQQKGKVHLLMHINIKLYNLCVTFWHQGPTPIDLGITYFNIFRKNNPSGFFSVNFLFASENFLIHY